MAPFLSGRYVLEYLRRRLVNHLNAGEIRQAPDFLGQGAVCPLYNLLKAFGICGAGHEANFTTRTSGAAWGPGRLLGTMSALRAITVAESPVHSLAGFRVNTCYQQFALIGHNVCCA